MAVFQIDNRNLLPGKEPGHLTVAAIAGDTTLTVENINGFSVTQYIWLGPPGDEQSEIVQVHLTTAPSGATITLATALSFPHPINTTIYQVDYNQVEFSRATTLAGSKTVLTTKNIESDDLFTSYADLVNTTGFAFIRFYNSYTTLYSSYGSGISYTIGFANNTVHSILKDAFKMTRLKPSETFSMEDGLREVNNWQQEVTWYRNWSFLATSTTATVVAGAVTFNVPSDLKRTHDIENILSVRIANYDPMSKFDKLDYNLATVRNISGVLATAIALIDTTITIDTPNDSFPTSGSIEIDGDVIAYTGYDSDTGIFSGVTGITATHAVGDLVWLASSVGIPAYYAVYDDDVYPYPVASSTYDDLTYHIDYIKVLADLTSEGDATEVPFHQTARYYVAWKMELAKGDPNDKAQTWFNLYNGMTAAQAKKDTQPVKVRAIVAM